MKKFAVFYRAELEFDTLDRVHEIRKSDTLLNAGKKLILEYNQAHFAHHSWYENSAKQLRNIDTYELLVEWVTKDGGELSVIEV